MRRHVVAPVVALTAVIGIAGCGEAPIEPGVVVATPQALVNCASPPAEGTLQARLWISGHRDPCFLDVAGGASSGRCVVTPGLQRLVTLDWFVDRGGVTVILAQAQKTVDLSRATGDVEVAFVDADYVIDGCLDMSRDAFAGDETVEVFGVQQPVCDLDGDGQQNVVEVCAGLDPLGAV